MNCGKWDPGFMFCGYCGEESGMVFYPEPSTDYDNPDEAPLSNDDEETNYFDNNSDKSSEQADIKDVIKVLEIGIQTM
jgi:hypothetical protein